METIEVSLCCKADLIEDYKDNPRDHHDAIAIYTCAQCKKECEVETVCAFCRGTGEREIMSHVYANEPHMAYLGDTVPCFCRKLSTIDI